MFPGLLLPNDTVNSESLMGIQPCGSGVISGYQSDEFITPGPQSSLLLFCAFTLASWVRCHHYSLSTWTKVWGLFVSRPRSCIFWTGLGFHPHWFHQDTRIGHILWCTWCHYFFSLFGGWGAAGHAGSPSLVKPPFPHSHHSPSWAAPHQGAQTSPW